MYVLGSLHDTGSRERQERQTCIIFRLDLTIVTRREEDVGGRSPSAPTRDIVSV
ncbi:hypothetical protein M404DRAFT_997266, partial [Pisolithus tinctorius Marx 270]